MAAARCINTMGLSLVMAFLGIYIVETRGYPAWVYGAIALGANVCQSLMAAWAGDLSDRIGRRPLIAWSLFLRAAATAVMGAQIIADAPLWSLAANIVVSWALRGSFEPVAYALVADVVPDARRIDAFGLQRMGTNLGWAIGPALGGVLTLVVPYGVVFFFAAAALAYSGTLALGIVDPVAAPSAPALAPPAARGELRRAFRAAIRAPLLRLLLAGTFFSALLQTQMFTTFGIFMTDARGLAKADVGLLYALNGAAVLVLQMPALALLRRIGLGRALPWASLIETLGFSLIAIDAGFAGGALAIVTLTCGEVLFNPAHQTAIAEAADPARRGRTYGIFTFAQMIGIACAPLCGGVLLDTIGHDGGAMWLTVAAIGVAQTACFAAFVRKRACRAAAA